MRLWLTCKFLLLCHLTKLWILIRHLKKIKNCWLSTQQQTQQRPATSCQTAELLTVTLRRHCIWFYGHFATFCTLKCTIRLWGVCVFTAFVSYHLVCSFIYSLFLNLPCFIAFCLCVFICNCLHFYLFISACSFFFLLPALRCDHGENGDKGSEVSETSSSNRKYIYIFFFLKSCSSPAGKRTIYISIFFHCDPPPPLNPTVQQLHCYMWHLPSRM